MEEQKLGEVCLKSVAGRKRGFDGKEAKIELKTCLHQSHSNPHKTFNFTAKYPYKIAP